MNNEDEKGLGLCIHKMSKTKYEYNKFQDDLPSHKFGLYIEHNAHIGSHRTVKDRIEDLDLDVDDFVNQDDMDKCISDNNLWLIQWYPDSSIGSYSVYGSSLEIIMTYINQ